MFESYLRESVSSQNPFRREGLLRRTLLLSIPLLVGFATFPYDANIGEAAFVAAVVLTLLTALFVLLVPWEGTSFWTIVPPLLYILCVVFLRHSAGGGLSGYGALYFVPAIWVALFGDRVQVLVVVITVGLAVVVPPVVMDEATSDEWRRALLTVLAAGAMSFAINSLVSALQLEMEQRDALEKRFRQGQALQMNDAVVQDLAVAKYSLDGGDTEQAREALGRALEGSKEIVATLIPKDGPMKPGDLAGPPPS
jgi:hypothetical protein